LTTGSNERSQIPIKMPVADVDHGSDAAVAIAKASAMTRACWAENTSLLDLASVR
jgi:hypothetical protein